VVVWYILWSFGIFVVVLFFLTPFGFVLQKIWQPCCAAKKTGTGVNGQGDQMSL
jgi:hypothetical protein